MLHLNLLMPYPSWGAWWGLDTRVVWEHLPSVRPLRARRPHQADSSSSPVLDVAFSRHL